MKQCRKNFLKIVYQRILFIFLLKLRDLTLNNFIFLQNLAIFPLSFLHALISITKSDYLRGDFEGKEIDDAITKERRRIFTKKNDAIE